ncbi:MAG TPA: prepilin peptidase [bacterium]|nr:prepilin peptidase [bacterium]HNS34324.1 prepilin peptidase [bacterium]HNZ73700.1 prepilin peptidase [bacterium]HOH67573.1 prepilin peptidase [bacterium]HQA63542.1 prepilin peptidase [bacterium]
MSFFLIFVLGAIVGSFLNVVILRLKSGEKISGWRSHCPHCRHDLSPLDLIPVISFFLRRGRCRYCRKNISWQYPLVELATALLFVGFFWFNLERFDCIDAWTCLFPLAVNWQLIAALLRDWVFVSVLLVIFVYDLRWYLILDRVTVPAMIVAVLANLILGLSWPSLLCGALIGGGFFWLQYVISSGKWIGGGDLRLGLLIGLMVGWPNVLVALFIAYLIGAVFSLYLVIGGKKKMKSPLPFGTFLAIATGLTMIWGEAIVNWYLSLLYV